MPEEAVGATGSEITRDTVAGGLAGGGIGALLGGGITYEGLGGLPPKVRMAIAIPAAVAGSIAGAAAGALTMGGKRWLMGKTVKTGMSIPGLERLGTTVKNPMAVARRPGGAVAQLKKVPGLASKVAEEPMRARNLSEALAKLAGDVDAGTTDDLENQADGGTGKVPAGGGGGTKTMPGPSAPLRANGLVGAGANPFKPTGFDSLFGKIAAKHWIAGAIKHPGALHKEMGVPQGQKIPKKKLDAAAAKGGKIGKRARLAETLRGFHHKKADVEKTADPDWQDTEPTDPVVVSEGKKQKSKYRIGGALLGGAFGALYGAGPGLVEGNRHMALIGGGAGAALGAGLGVWAGHSMGRNKEKYRQWTRNEARDATKSASFEEIAEVERRVATPGSEWVDADREGAIAEALGRLIDPAVL